MFAAVGLLAAALSAQPRSYEPDWNRPAKPHRIIDNVYFVGTNNLGVFLVTTRAGHILIDPGFDETVPLIRDSMRALGFRYEDVRILLTTQAHFDHVAALARIKRDTGARVEAMTEDAGLLESGGRDDFVFGDDRPFPPVTVDRRLNDGDIVSLENVRLKAIHTPGHTPGATTFTTVVSEGGWSHQLIFAASITINPGTRLVGNPRYPRLVEDWQRTYAVLESLSPGVWLAAHTGLFGMDAKVARAGGGENPFIDPAGYRRYLANGRQQLSAALAAELSR